MLVTEDAAFWAHDGVDYARDPRVDRADWLRGEPLRGASTITQQLAKNLYLSPSRNPYRKVTELLIARRLEAELSKARILELYLNLIEWGDGIWGAEAAAETYFGISASALSPEQAALLAGAIINPRELNPGKPEQAARAATADDSPPHGGGRGAAGAGVPARQRAGTDEVECRHRLMEQTLLLNATYEPLRVVHWQKAITLWCQGKVEIVAALRPRDPLGLVQHQAAVGHPAAAAHPRAAHGGVRAVLARQHLRARQSRAASTAATCFPPAS